MPAAAPPPRISSAALASSRLPDLHAAGGVSRSDWKTTAEAAEARHPTAYGGAGHAEPPPAGPSADLAADADRVAGTMSHSFVVGRASTDAKFDAAAASTSRGSQAAAAGDVPAGGQVPHALRGLSPAGADVASSYSAPSQTLHADPLLPPPEPVSAPQPALAAQEVTPPSTAATQPEQLPPHTLTTPLTGGNVARPDDNAEPRAVPVKRKPRERRVPSSPFGRVMGFAGLGASLVAGTVRDSVAGYFQPRPADGEKPVSAVSASARPLHYSLDD